MKAFLSKFSKKSNVDITLNEDNDSTVYHQKVVRKQALSSFYKTSSDAVNTIQALSTNSTVFNTVDCTIKPSDSTSTTNSTERGSATKEIPTIVIDLDEEGFIDSYAPFRSTLVHDSDILASSERISVVDLEPIAPGAITKKVVDLVNQTSTKKQQSLTVFTSPISNSKKRKVSPNSVNNFSASKQSNSTVKSDLQDRKLESVWSCKICTYCHTDTKYSNYLQCAVCTSPREN